MSYPKKNNIKVYTQSELTERRKELLERITKSDTFLPESILHDDLDLGMLDFVKQHFNVISDGKEIPIIPKILTIQRWGEFTNNWTFSDEDGNVKLPFIAIIRKPDVQPGTNPAAQRTIPDRRGFFYASVPTFNGRQIGADVYKIPQPIPVDLTFDVTIICTKFRDVNKFNQIIMTKFSSRQSYTTVKGHYIPIILDKNDDTTPMETLEGRRFYVQNYTFTMLGFLIDDEEFEVKPAINRVLLMTEFISSNNFKRKYVNRGIDLTVMEFTATSGDTTFNVGEIINTLVLVLLNNTIQKIGTDFYYITNTSRITFASPLNTNDEVSITYFKSKDEKFTDLSGKELNIIEETFIYSGTTLIFESIHPLNNLICLGINNVVKNEEIDYEIANLNEITILTAPSPGEEIKIIYLY